MAHRWYLSPVVGTGRAAGTKGDADPGDSFRAYVIDVLKASGEAVNVGAGDLRFDQGSANGMMVVDANVSDAQVALLAKEPSIMELDPRKSLDGILIASVIDDLAKLPPECCNPLVADLAKKGLIIDIGQKTSRLDPSKQPAADAIGVPVTEQVG